MDVSDIKTVACVGGGVIGSSWAIQFSKSGLSVRLYDINDEQLAKSRAQMEKSLDYLLSADAIDKKTKADILSRVTFTTDMKAALDGVQFIQESGPERLEIKQSILAQIDEYAPKSAIYATSSSGLVIDDIVAKSAHKNRCVGGHPYNPPHLIPLVEMTQSAESDPAIVKLAYDFYQSVGKEAVLLRKACPGYIANRLQLAVYREVIELMRRGVCTAEDADKALTFGPGIRWAIFGHNMIMQLGNPDGLTGMVKMLGTAGNVWLRDMANWVDMPDDYAEIAQKGVDEEMKNFPDYIGHTNAECAAYRDKMLIEMLKLHKKL